MATVHQQPAIPAGRAAECGMAVFGLLIAAVIAYISLDLLTDGMLTRLAGGAVAATSPAPGPPQDIPRPRPAPEASGAV